MPENRTENVELTVLCLVSRGEEYLLQNRVREDWKGLTLPGGHVERGESIVDAVVREMREETGLTVFAPRLCGVKQFPIENGRYLVFLFRTDRFTGELRSSDEGQMQWVRAGELPGLGLVDDFETLLEVMLNDSLNEFQYRIEENGSWTVTIQ